MFDIGADELLLTAVVAVVVIGPKDLPRALRTVGKWVAKMRRMSNAFRSGIDNVIREAELEEMEEQWRKQNAAIMQSHPAATADADAEAAAATAAAHGDAAMLSGPGAAFAPQQDLPAAFDPSVHAAQPPADPAPAPEHPDPEHPAAEKPAGQA